MKESSISVESAQKIFSANGEEWDESYNQLDWYVLTDSEGIEKIFAYGYEGAWVSNFSSLSWL